MPAQSNVHAFLGTDEALVKEAALHLSQKLAPKDNEFGLEIVNGSADNADGAIQVISRTIEAIQTLPFFGGDKVVWLQGVNFLGESQTGRAESTLNALESLIDLLEQGLPAEVSFILSAGEIDKRRSFYKRLNKLTKIKIFDRLDTTKAGWEAAVMRHVSERAVTHGLKFRGAALERFVQRVGANTRSIDGELEKLSLYVGDRPATEDDVATVVSQSHTGYIFDIGEAIAQRDLPSALQLIDFQLNRGESAIPILLAAIIPRVRNLLHLSDLIETHRVRVGRQYSDFQKAIGQLPSSATGHLSRTKEGGFNLYPLFMTAKSGLKFTVAELKDALEYCLEANLRLVTTSLDPRLVLHQLVTRILTRKTPSSRAL